MVMKKKSLKSSQVKQACVTGASGFVGKRLVDQLMSEGFLVRVLTHNRKRTFPDGVEIFYADLASTSCNLKNFFSECDLFFHCAGDIKTTVNMHALHVDGVKRLLKAFCDEIDLTGHPIHWVQLSSVGVYGKSINKSSKVRKITESSKIDPYGEYEITKAKADKLLLEAAKSGVFTFSILRPSNIIGIGMPNQSFRELIKNINRRRFFYIGSIHTVSNYVHVDDVVEALILCSQCQSAVNQIFNLSNDCKLSDIVLSLSLDKKVRHKIMIIPEWLVRLLINLTPSFLKLPLTQSRIDALVSRVSYPNTKIKQMLKFLPKKTIPDFAVDCIIDASKM
jgi:nucleoside-diphosphate-sugar epimerase